jgi:glutamate/aspartate transport system substrate-binding protein
MTGSRVGGLVSCAMLAGLAASAAAQPIGTMQRIRDTGTLPVGVRDAAFPFSFLDDSKRAQGYSIDLCLKIADAIKNALGLSRLEVTYIPVTPANRIGALLNNQIDLECGSTGNTRDLQQRVAFAYTTFVSGIRILTKKSSGIAGVDDLRGKTIVVTRDTPSEKLMTRIDAERQLKMTMVVADSNEASFRAIEEGTAAAFPLDEVVLYALIAKAKQPDQYAVVGKYLSVEPYAIMMRKGEPQLEMVVDKTLAGLFASGEVMALYEKWFATPELTIPMNPLLKEAFTVPNSYPGWP